MVAGGAATMDLVSPPASAPFWPAAAFPAGPEP